MKKLGIIGGMGPAATAQLFKRIVDFTDVNCDQDHLDITILNKPSIPDRTAYLLGKSNTPFVPIIKTLAHELADKGCKVIAIPCNTAHAKINEISEGMEDVTFVNIPEEAIKFSKSLSCSRVGILATTGTIKTGIYQSYATKHEIETIAPEDNLQNAIMNVIYDYIKAGKELTKEQVKQLLDQAIDEIECECFILGCTELSLLNIPTEYRNCYFIDALDVQAWKCVVECEAPAKDLSHMFNK